MAQTPNQEALIEALSRFSEGMALLVQASGMAPADSGAGVEKLNVDLKTAAEMLDIGKTKFLEYRDLGYIKPIVINGRPKYRVKDVKAMNDRLIREGKRKKNE